MENNPSGRFDHANKTFAALKLPDWTIDRDNVPQGGQSGVCVVVNKTGLKGVFRCLPPQPTELSIKRFHRELEALAKVTHRNVMKPLASSDQPPYWYISEKGENFRVYWKALAKGEDAIVIEEAALSIVRQLGAALAACHNCQLIHRDIKPNNVIIRVINGEDVPILIDFGVVWVEGGERLTNEGESVGNARYAPDLLRQRAESCPPWVDVFSLVQMFQWMVAERGDKHYWNRPTHWRYVQYPEGHTPFFITALRALSAACSAEASCPANGDEFCGLLGRLFALNTQQGAVASPGNAHAIARAIADGLQKKTVRETEDREVLESAREVAGILLERVKEMAIAITKDDPRVRALECNAFGEMFRLENRYRENLIKLQCSVTSNASFEWRIEVDSHVLSRWTRYPRPVALNGVTFAFSIARNWTGSSDKVVISIERDGKLKRHKSGDYPDEGKEISLGDVEAIIRDTYADPAVWSKVAEGGR